MNRREFLTSLLGATTAAIVLPSVATVEAFAPDAVEPWLTSYDAVLREAWARLCEFTAGYGAPIATAPIFDTHAIGYALPDGVIVSNQLSVDFGTHGATQDRFIEPAMRHLAMSIDHHGIDRFIQLLIPQGCEYARQVGALRLVVCERMEDRVLLARFDVAGGVSADGRRRVERRRQGRLVGAIKHRLTYPRRVLPLPV